MPRTLNTTNDAVVQGDPLWVWCLAVVAAVVPPPPQELLQRSVLYTTRPHRQAGVHRAVAQRPSLLPARARKALGFTRKGRAGKAVKPDRDQDQFAPFAHPLGRVRRHVWDNALGVRTVCAKYLSTVSAVVATEQYRKACPAPVAAINARVILPRNPIFTLFALWDRHRRILSRQSRHSTTTTTDLAPGFAQTQRNEQTKNLQRNRTPITDNTDKREPVVSALYTGRTAFGIGI